MKDLFRTLSNLFSASGDDQMIHYAGGPEEFDASTEDQNEDAEANEDSLDDLLGSEDDFSEKGRETIAKAMPRISYDRYAELAKGQAVKGLKFNKKFDVRSFKENGTTLTGDEIAKAFRKVTYEYAKLQTEYSMVENAEGNGFDFVSLNLPGLREDKAPKLYKEAGRFLVNELTPEQLSNVLVMVNEMIKDGRHGRHAVDQYLKDLITPMIEYNVNAKAYVTKKERKAVREDAKQELASLISNPTEYGQPAADTAIASRERPPRPER